ncbi:hypothetical protein [Kitasatospora sp. NPDC090091]|uniref:hypothetical protein n=1 Tax=Kitasatospora sp. NPDC090091 TaxID=3364081 RepID=UPI00380E6D71
MQMLYVTDFDVRAVAGEASADPFGMLLRGSASRSFETQLLTTPGLQGVVA